MQPRSSGFLAPVFGVLCIAALLILLQMSIRAGLIDAYTVPLPSDMLASLPRLVTDEHVVSRFGITFGETLSAGLLALLAGVAIGIVLHRWPRLRRAFESWFALLAAAPLVLAYPLFLVLFGRSARTIIAIAFASALAPVVLKTVEGFGAIRPVLIDVGRSLRLRPAQEFRMILLPAALPHIFVGLRLALIFALINVVGVEFLINLGGLGQLINELAERFDLPGTWASIGLVVVISICFFLMLEGGERWLRTRG